LPLSKFGEKVVDPVKEKEKELYKELENQYLNKLSS